MQLTINGDIVQTGAATVLDLLAELRVVPERVAVEVNMEIVKKAAYSSFTLRDGDRIEIVNFVGGGRPGADLG